MKNVGPATAGKGTHVCAGAPIPVGSLGILRRTLSSLFAVALVTLAVLVPMPRAHAADDPFSGDQWALIKVGAPTAWAATTGSGVRIGIVDTGIDLNHQDLASKVVANADCTGSGGCAAGGSAGADDHGHGTHVAGAAAAVTGNGVGIAGMAPDASLVVAKALGADGSGNAQDVDEAIRWVVDNGAKVVNLSLGSDLPVLGVLGGDSLGPAIAYAWDRGAVPVISAGNDSSLVGSSNYRNLNAIVVGATGPDDSVASYSSSIDARYGIVAPGGDGDCTQASGGAQRCILSTYTDNKYALMRGTSMAAPQVSGAAALLVAQGFNRDDTVQRLLGNANKSVACGPNCSGRLDVAAAVDPSKATPPPPVTTDNSGNPNPAPAEPAPGEPAPGDPAPGNDGGGNPSPSPTTPAPDGGGTTSPGGKVGIPVNEPATIVAQPSPGASAPIPAPPPPAPPAPVAPQQVVVVPAPAATPDAVPPPLPTATSPPPPAASNPVDIALPAGAGLAEPATAPATEEVPPDGAGPEASPSAVPAPAPTAEAARTLVHLRITEPASSRPVIIALGIGSLLLGGFGRAMSLRRRTLSTLVVRPGPDTLLPVGTGLPVSTGTF